MIIVCFNKENVVLTQRPDLFAEIGTYLETLPPEWQELLNRLNPILGDMRQPMTQQDNARKRGFLEILAGMMEALSEGPMARTHLVYATNLNFRRLPRYLEYLEKVGLLTRVTNKNGTAYLITEKGKLFLKRYDEMVSMLQGQK